MFAIQDEVTSTGNYLKYNIKDKNAMIIACCSLWLFNGNYPTCD
jgi:hypothetical protein